jgi:hypothetical protein
MRRALGIDVVDVRGWDGAVRPPPLAPEELRRRWDAYRVRVRERQRQQREDTAP